MEASILKKKNRKQTPRCSGRTVAFVMGDYENRALETHSLVVYKTRLLGVTFSTELKKVHLFQFTYMAFNKEDFILVRSGLLGPVEEPSRNNWLS